MEKLNMFIDNPDNKLESEMLDETEKVVDIPLPPNNTLYLNNINERIRIDDLKE